MRTAAIVLAAGQATRYRAAGGQAPSKLVDRFGGEALVCYPVRAALGTGLPVIVVTGHAAEAVEAVLADCPVRYVHNVAYATGLASSLRTGLDALDPTIDAALVLLGDMPLVDPATLTALIAAAEAATQAMAVVPVVDGERGNPVLLRRALFAAASRLAGDEGARRLLRDPALIVAEVPMMGDAVRRDIDDPAGFAA